MKKVLFTICIFGSFFLVAQEPEIGISKEGIIANYLNRQGVQGMDTEGSFYLVSEYQLANVKLTGSEKEGRYPARLNLNSRVLEIRDSGSDYYIPWTDLEYVLFELTSELFVYETSLQDLAKVHFNSDDCQVLEFFDLKLKESQYNASLNVAVSPEWVITSQPHVKVGSELSFISNKKDWKMFLEKYPQFKASKKKLKSVKVQGLVEYFQDN